MTDAEKIMLSRKLITHWFECGDASNADAAGTLLDNVLEVIDFAGDDDNG